ncbi:MAG: helix-turn-helix transcriptional regulator [Gemmatimonadaceae bacterium]
MPASSIETAELCLIRLPQVLNIVACSKTEVYRLIRAGKFPKPVPLGARSSAWILAEVYAFVANRIARREKGTRDRSELGRRLVRSRTALAPHEVAATIDRKCPESGKIDRRHRKAEHATNQSCTRLGEQPPDRAGKLIEVAP